eukprot:96070-Amphidinium_carterae.1
MESCFWANWNVLLRWLPYMGDLMTSLDKNRLRVKTSDTSTVKGLPPSHGKGSTCQKTTQSKNNIVAILDFVANYISLVVTDSDIDAAFVVPTRVAHGVRLVAARSSPLDSGLCLQKPLWKKDSESATHLR